jgi:hypothetical protein
MEMQLNLYFIIHLFAIGMDLKRHLQSIICGTGCKATVGIKIGTLYCASALLRGIHVI